MTSVLRSYAQRNTNLVDVKPVASVLSMYTAPFDDTLDTLNYAYYSVVVDPSYTTTFTVNMSGLAPSRVVGVDLSGNMLSPTNYFRFNVSAAAGVARAYPGLEFTVVFKSFMENTVIDLVEVPVNQEFTRSMKPSDAGYSKFTHQTVTYKSDGVEFVLSGSSPKMSPTAEFWVAGGYSSQSYFTTTNVPFIYSYDGVLWNFNTISDPFGGNILCQCLAYNGKIWVAGGESGAIAYSTDGIHWNLSDSSGHFNGGDCYAVAWNDMMWVAGGSGSGENPFAYSYDGITWLPSDSSGVFGISYCRAVGWNGSVWVAGLDSANPLAYSRDGMHWTPSDSSGILNVCRSVAWNGSLWVGGGDRDSSGTMIYSTDGVRWFPATNDPFPTSECNTVAWNGTLWVAGGSGDAVLAYSADGKYWFPSLNMNIYANRAESVAWNGTLWVAAVSDGAAYMVYSKDGISWTVAFPGNNTFIPYVFNLAYAVATR